MKPLPQGAKAFSDTVYFRSGVIPAAMGTAGQVTRRTNLRTIGGLGHLGVQFARRLGFHTVAIAGGPEKKKLAEEMGAHQYIDSGERMPQPLCNGWLARE